MVTVHNSLAVAVSYRGYFYKKDCKFHNKITLNAYPTIPRCTLSAPQGLACLWRIPVQDLYEQIVQNHFSFTSDLYKNKQVIWGLCCSRFYFESGPLWTEVDLDHVVEDPDQLYQDVIPIVALAGRGEEGKTSADASPLLPVVNIGQGCPRTTLPCTCGTSTTSWACPLSHRWRSSQLFLKQVSWLNSSLP